MNESPNDLQWALTILAVLEDELHHRLLQMPPDAPDESQLARDCRDVNSLWNRLSIAVYPPPLGGRIEGESAPAVFLTPADAELLQRCAQRVADSPSGGPAKSQRSEINRVHDLLFPVR